MRRARVPPEARPGAAAAPGPRPDARGLLAFCAVALVLRAVLLWQLHDHPLLQPGFGLDTDLFVDLARRVAAGDLVLAPGAYPAAPVYIYFLGGVFALTGGSLLAARAVQILAGAVAVWLVGDTARRWFGPGAAVPAALLAALCGPFAFNEVLVLQSSLDPVLFALASWQLTRAMIAARSVRQSAGRDGGRHEGAQGEQGTAARAWLAAGVAWAAVALNRPNALPYLAVIAAGIPWLSGRRGWRPLAAFALGGLLLLGPVALRNRSVTGDLVLIASHGGFNLFVGNNPEADGTYRSVEGVTPSSVRQAADTRRVAEQAVGRPLTDREVSDYFRDRALAWIRGAPIDALQLLARKLRYVVAADEIALNYSYAYYRHDEPTVLTLMPVGPWLLLPLGLVGLVAGAPRGDRAYLVWAAFVPVYALGVAIFFVAERYRLPLLVPLASASGGLIAAAGATVSARQWGRLGAGVLAVAAVAVLAWWPTGLDDGRGEERTSMAEVLIRGGEAARAQRLIDETLPGHPEPALLLFRAGRALQAAGDRPSAIARYEQALARDPARAEIRFFLGQCLLDQRRAVEAIPHLDAAVAAGVRRDVAPFDLARALASTGDYDAARRALARLAIPPQADTASFVNAGQMAEGLRDAPLAIRFYAAAAERPDAPVAVVERLGVLLAMSGRAREAIAVLERGVRQSPGAASLHLNLAVALAQDGRFDEARARVAEALRLRPDYPQAGALAERLGRR